MNVREMLTLLVSSTLFFTTLGGAAGFALGKYLPGYYRSVFRSGFEPEFDPVAVGVGQGLTQGMTGGAVIGVLLVFLLGRHRMKSATTSASERSTSPTVSTSASRNNPGSLLLLFLTLMSPVFILGRV
jgi:hypothetical protein